MYNIIILVEMITHYCLCISQCSTFRLQLTITGEEYIEDVITITVEDCTVSRNE